MLLRLRLLGRKGRIAVMTRARPLKSRRRTLVKVLSFFGFKNIGFKVVLNVDLLYFLSLDDLKPRTQIDIGKESAIEAEVRAARERAVVPLETRIKSFREMLAEKEVGRKNLAIRFLEHMHYYEFHCQKTYWK